MEQSAIGPMGQQPAHVQAADESLSFHIVTNSIRRRCGVSVNLAPCTTVTTYTRDAVGDSRLVIVRSELIHGTRLQGWARDVKVKFETETGPRRSPSRDRDETFVALET